MKLKIFDQSNLPVINVGKPSIHLNKTGAFTINQVAAGLLGIKSGACVKLAQDESTPGDWYIFLAPGSDGFPVRAKSKKRRLHFQQCQISYYTF